MISLLSEQEGSGGEVGRLCKCLLSLPPWALLGFTYIYHVAMFCHSWHHAIMLSTRVRLRLLTSQKKTPGGAMTSFVLVG